jgi:aldose 1-epimerase
VSGPDFPYYGSTVGRVANRIARGAFSIDGEVYSLATNNGPNALHGGIKGFSHVVWSVRTFAADGNVGVEFSYDSVDGEEGYPGNLRVIASYVLNVHNELRMEFFATTDKVIILFCAHFYIIRDS